MALTDCRILVVEDEYLLAQDMRIELEGAGAIVIGPEPTVEKALRRVLAEPRVDAAVLDVNLGDGLVFPVADVLQQRQVPFVFASGYGDEALAKGYVGAVNCQKPFDMRSLVRTLDRVVHGIG